LPKRSVGIRTATYGLLMIFASMTLLAALRNRFPKWKPQVLAFFRGEARA
jgi:hypothetical protein